MKIETAELVSREKGKREKKKLEEEQTRKHEENEKMPNFEDWVFDNDTWSNFVCVSLLFSMLYQNNCSSVLSKDDPYLYIK